MKHSGHTRTRGFTLIELLVVIAIISVLAGILFPVFAKARSRARETTALSTPKQIAAALQLDTADYDEHLQSRWPLWPGYGGFNWRGVHVGFAEAPKSYVRAPGVWSSP